MSDAYNTLIELGAKPQEARYVLLNGLKTELVATGTFPQWINFFKQRTAPDAHPQMQALIKPFVEELSDEKSEYSRFMLCARFYNLL
jgi:thymidylate synthase (FAD)